MKCFLIVKTSFSTAENNIFRYGKRFQSYSSLPAIGAFPNRKDST